MEENNQPTPTEQVKKYFKIIFPILVSLAIAFGFWQWQFGTETEISPINNLYKGVADNSFDEYYRFTQDYSVQNSAQLNFIAVGDIMLSRNVAGQISKNGKNSQWPFEKLQSVLRESDFNFGNLESPYTGRDDFNPSGSLVFNAPTWTLKGLTDHNFKVLNLANNHAFDQGLEGLLFTKKLLNENNITTVGAGANQAEAWQGQVFEDKGIKIGFIGASYASVNDGGLSKNENVARIEDVAKLKSSIADLRTRSDFIVVTMHAGTEYTRSPNQAQIDFARSAIDSGADIVIGAHPHWIQTFEQYQGKYIFYSLGNFIFDQMWSQDTKEGLMLKISVEKSGCPSRADGNPNPGNTGSPTNSGMTTSCNNELQGTPIPATLKQIELVPIVIESYGQPRPATETETKNILKKIGATTAVVTP